MYVTIYFMCYAEFYFLRSFNSRSNRGQNDFLKDLNRNQKFEKFLGQDLTVRFEWAQKMRNPPGSFLKFKASPILYILDYYYRPNLLFGSLYLGSCWSYRKTKATLLYQTTHFTSNEPCFRSLGETFVKKVAQKNHWPGESILWCRRPSKIIANFFARNLIPKRCTFFLV